MLFCELSAKFDHLDKFSLRDREERYLLFIKKEEKTNSKYPRKEGKPKKKTFIKMFHVKHFTDRIHRCFT